MNEEIKWFKHPVLPYPGSVRREIILAAEQKSNSCEIIRGLLNIIEEEFSEYERQIAELEDTIKDLEDQQSAYDEEMAKLRDELAQEKEKFDG